jgi:putative membrane protein
MNGNSHHHLPILTSIRYHLLCLGTGIVLAVLALRPKAVLAHDGSLVTPDTIWGRWNWNPAILIGLVLTAWLYAQGVHALWQRAGIGRGVVPWQVIAFVGGLVALSVALVSPLDALATALFSAHMGQHLLLILVAAPLLVLGTPLVPFLWALRHTRRRRLGRWWRKQTALQMGWRALTQPLVVWLLHATAVWIWHVPSLYQAALRSEWVHAVEHISFLGTALLFWWILFHPSTHGRLGYGVGVLYIFGMATQGVVLGALMTFAQTPWYRIHETNTAAWNLTPLEDQQLAGLIMWVPPSVIYLLAAVGLFVAWFGALEQAMRRKERRRQIHPSERTAEMAGEHGQERSLS